MIKPLNYDLLRSQVPAFYYKRFKVDDIRIKFYFSIPLDYGFGYLLRRISSKWSEEVIPNGNAYHKDVKYTLIHTTRGRRLNDLPAPLRLVSTPAETNVFLAAAPAPVDNDGYGVCFAATPVKNRLVFNEYYFYRETLFIEFIFNLNMNTTPAELITAYLDVMLDGYLIPEKSLEMWG